MGLPFLWYHYSATMVPRQTQAKPGLAEHLGKIYLASGVTTFSSKRRSCGLAFFPQGARVSLDTPKCALRILTPRFRSTLVTV